jgi:TPR repeat protein
MVQGKEVTMDIKAKERKGTYRTLIVGLLTLLFSTSLAVAAYSGEWENAVAAYERGDYTTAFRLSKPTAEQGIAKTQFNLGVSYEDGQGVPRKYTLAHMWFDLASSALEGEGWERAIKNRNSVASKMTLEQVADAQLLAREWKPKKE